MPRQETDRNHNIRRRFWFAVAFLTCFAGCRRSTSPDRELSPADMSTTPVARAPIGGEWTRAAAPREWSFPRDHGAHTDHWMEWWYYTGNVKSETGRQFGFQLTFFRTGVDRKPTATSAWAVRDIYVAHFAISDVEDQKISSFEKSNRAGIGWAGADEDPDDSTVRIWNAGWETSIQDSGNLHHLKATADNASIDLTLTAAKPLVQHHGDGLSQKGPSPGNASHYYSYPSLDTSGIVRIDGKEHAVQGSSWMDHEFSSSFLEKGQVGWDWMAIQLDDDTQVMLYQIRLEDGSPSPFSSGTVVYSDGRQEILTVDDIKMHPKKHWVSKGTKAKYPISWTVQVSKADLDLTVEAAFEDQEMDTSSSTGIVYWEGCVNISGTRNSANVAGKGYLEMTGYVHPR
jgi:predicted secreted hydrolase